MELGSIIQPISEAELESSHCFGNHPSMHPEPEKQIANSIEHLQWKIIGKDTRHNSCVKELDTLCYPCSSRNSLRPDEFTRITLTSLPDIQLLRVPFGTYSKTRITLLTVESSK